MRGLELGHWIALTVLSTPVTGARVARFISPAMLTSQQADRVSVWMRRFPPAKGQAEGQSQGTQMTGSLANAYSSLKCIYQLLAMNNHFKSIKRRCKHFSSWCCYLLLHLLDIYSHLIFGCISKSPVIGAKRKTFNAYCFACVAKIIQKINFVQIP